MSGTSNRSTAGTRPPGCNPMAESTYHLLRGAAEWNPEGIALTFLADPSAPPSRLTHRQFFGRVTQAANLFHRLGVRSNDCVSLLAPSLPDAIVALWAAEAAGIANPINFLLRTEDIAAMLRETQSKVLVSLGPHPALDIWKKTEALRSQVPSLKAIVTLGHPVEGPGVSSFEREVAQEPGDRLISGRTILPTDIAAYFHTGGTTAAPKIARHSHRNQVFVATSLGHAWELDCGTRMINGLPMFHVAGSILVCLAPLVAGGEIIVPTAAGMRHPQVVAQHWKLVERYRPTVVGGLPTTLVALLDVPLEGEDIGSVKFCATGGATLPVAVATEFQRRFGLAVHEIFGMTECAGLISTWPADRSPVYGAVGYGVPGVEIEARRMNGEGNPAERLPPEEIGILVVRGPNVFAGYLHEQQTARAFTQDGWLITGDLGSVGADGLLRVTGRAKDVIIRSGHNIDPARIEDAANEHPAVAVSAAVGLPDTYAGEVPILYVSLRADTTASVEELQAHMNRAVPEGPARPREVVVLPNMPMTAVGKVFKPVLRADATRRAVTAACANLLSAASAEAQVDVTETQGGRWNVHLFVRSCAPERQPDLREKLGATLSRFAFEHEISFG